LEGFEAGIVGVVAGAGAEDIAAGCGAAGLSVFGAQAAPAAIRARSVRLPFINSPWRFSTRFERDFE
jgi:hypothetical protein